MTAAPGARRVRAALLRWRFLELGAARRHHRSLPVLGIIITWSKVNSRIEQRQNFGDLGSDHPKERSPQRAGIFNLFQQHVTASCGGDDDAQYCRRKRTELSCSWHHMRRDADRSSRYEGIAFIARSSAATELPYWSGTKFLFFYMLKKHSMARGVIN